MNLKKIFKDVSLTFVLLMLASILGYIVRILFARNLSTVNYGLFYAIIGLVSFFAIFRTLGTSEALVHFIPKYFKEKNWKKLKFSINIVFYTQLIIGFVIAALFFIFAKPIAIHFFHLETATILIRIQAITFFVIGFVELFSSIFRGFQRPALAALYDPIRLTIVTLLTILLIKIGLFNVKHLLIVWLISYLVLVVVYLAIYYFDYKRLIKVAAKKYGSVIRDIKTYSIPLMIGVAADLILSRTDVILLTFFKGVTDVAFYEIAFPSSRLMLLLVAPFSFVLFPMVSKFFFEKQKHLIKEILQMIYNTGLFLLAPIAVLLIIYPELVIKTLFSVKYIEAADALRIMTLGSFFLIFSQINFNILSGIGEIRIKTKILYFVAFFNIIFDIILIPPLGYMGAIIVTATSFFLLWLLGYIVCFKKISHFRINLRAIGKIFAALAVFLIVVIALKQLLVLNLYIEAVLVTLISLAVYFFLGIFIFKIINLGLLKQPYKQIRR